MNREILFRGKNDAGEWLYGYLTKPAGNPCFVIDGEDYFGGVIEETIGQYTGLCDKNGTKIFEGDVVKGCSKSYKKNYLCEVYFNENMCHYGLTINRGSYTKHQTHDWLELTKTKASKLEVVGNIYDNPELLEK